MFCEPAARTRRRSMSKSRQVSNRAAGAVDYLDAQIRKLPAQWLVAYVALAAILAIAAACMPSI